MARASRRAHSEAHGHSSHDLFKFSSGICFHVLDTKANLHELFISVDIDFGSWHWPHRYEFTGDFPEA